MKTLESQTIYQCDYCNKRFLSKNGVKKHEEIYCHVSPIPKQNRLEKVKNCNHEWDMQYSRMASEPHLLEPDHQECIHCGVWDSDWFQIRRQMKEETK